MKEWIRRKLNPTTDELKEQVEKEQLRAKLREAQVRGRQAKKKGTDLFSFNVKDTDGGKSIWDFG